MRRVRARADFTVTFHGHDHEECSIKHTCVLPLIGSLKVEDQRKMKGSARSAPELGDKRARIGTALALNNLNDLNKSKII